MAVVDFNRFGAVYTDVIAMYPGTVAADYGTSAAVGQANIEATMDRVVNDLLAEIPWWLLKLLQRIHAEEVVTFATAGQTTATLGITDFVEADFTNIEVWLNLRDDSTFKPGSTKFPLPDSDSYLTYTTDFTVAEAGGVVTITLVTALSEGDTLHVSYDLDIDNAAYGFGFLKDLVVLGAAWRQGARLFAEREDEVISNREEYDMGVKNLKDGKRLPYELRTLVLYPGFYPWVG